jgi:hypothetical protein
MPPQAASPEAQLEGFLVRYAPEIAARGRAAIAWMRKRYPAANILVYDNYNALAVGFGPSQKSTEAVFSIALYPRWVSLFFLLNGTTIPDPDKRLKGSGKRVRHIILSEGIATLESSAGLMAASVAQSGTDLVHGPAGRLIIKSISAKQRPRRPA